MFATDAKAVLHLLGEMYPQMQPALNFQNPFELLVSTILAAQCTDARVNMVTPALFRDYPDAFAMAGAEPEDIYPYVKSCGFSAKAKNIVLASRKIVSDHAGIVPSDMEDLVALPGVGRKTANVVRAFGFGLPAIPVDTHVLRVSNRLGLASALTPEETEKQLMALIPEENWSDAHHWMLYHGRYVCHSQKPECERCRLKELCLAANTQMINPKLDARKKRKETKP